MKPVFSLSKREDVLRAFVREHILTNEEIDSGAILVNSYPYEIVFDDIYDGITILENLPTNVLVSFQTLKGGAAYAVIRLIRSKQKERKGK